ncbi:MAG TPA: hypothetical protein PKD64_17560 [Pirellulaceae bacterium]|nr:hypothetical protein [Pirellulaceae bacterium]HMO93996.1 hypothetical protein [Pirellulaceae bacterium]HMP70868.1 hypothetical protein [Pirellulaceae bacterium]
MQFNLFSWIREGVKRSVMLGVADAVQQVGTPLEGGDLQGSLQHFLQNIEKSSDANLVPGNVPNNGGRKRLGRSLRDIDGQ